MQHIVMHRASLRNLPNNSPQVFNSVDCYVINDMRLLGPAPGIGYNDKSGATSAEVLLLSATGQELECLPREVVFSVSLRGANVVTNPPQKLIYRPGSLKTRKMRRRILQSRSQFRPLGSFPKLLQSLPRSASSATWWEQRRISLE